MKQLNEELLIYITKFSKSTKFYLDFQEKGSQRTFLHIINLDEDEGVRSSKREELGYSVPDFLIIKAFNYTKNCKNDETFGTEIILWTLYKEIVET